MTTAKRPPLSKAERQRKIKAIQAEFEAKRRELGMRAPAFRGGPVFYLGLMAVLTVLGLSLIKASEKGGKTSIMDRLKSAKTTQQTDKPSPHKEMKSEREL